MAKIAIIGTGIAGLSAAGLLHARHDITVYEKASRTGGHSRTVTVRHGDRDIAVDTGFIVFNRRNYPNLTALFELLGVPLKHSDMSFALTVGGGDLEWGARSLDAVFGQRRNLIRPKFLKLVLDVLRFNRQAEAAVAREPGLTLGGLLVRMGLGGWFRDHYILPMAGAIWSCPPRQMLEFPALTFVRFFANHRLLSMRGQPQWLTVDGGSQVYVDRLSALFADRILTGCGAARVLRDERGAVVTGSDGRSDHYDHVVMACHADEALALLGDADAPERAALGAIRYQRNLAVLHKDPTFMPKNRRCWASWVYHADRAAPDAGLSVTYWMNSLQAIDEKYPLFVTLNPTRPVPDAHVFDRHMFDHPVFDFGALKAQVQLEEMQGQRRTWFCGAHMGHGFHEDGLVSAMRLAAALGAPASWTEGAQAGQGWTDYRPVRPAAVLP